MQLVLLAIIGILALLAAVLFFAVSRQPDRFRIARSAHIDAAPERVFHFLNDFHEWVYWSPWEERDPDLKRTYEGAPSGPGARYHWVGNKNVGEGTMTLTDSAPGEFVAIQIEFLKPFAATNQVRFTLTPDHGGTRVEWAMEGTNNLMGKLFGLLMNMDKMIGTDFDHGLAKLRAAAESPEG
ncbi:MAG: polyketide cyclase [Candidatus Hydrogenedens sp.]|nr:polyketide cyclase [Candidatus Hydrogenedens sp.]